MKEANAQAASSSTREKLELLPAIFFEANSYIFVFFFNHSKLNAVIRIWN